MVPLLLQVPPADNYFAALNSAVFTDGSFVYIPKGVDCPMELSTYFRINAEESGQVSRLSQPRNPQPKCLWGWSIAGRPVCASCLPVLFALLQINAESCRRVLCCMSSVCEKHEAEETCKWGLGSSGTDI